MPLETTLRKGPWKPYFRCVKCHTLINRFTRVYKDVCPGCGITAKYVYIDTKTYSKRRVYGGWTHWIWWTRWVWWWCGRWEYKEKDPFISKPPAPKTKQDSIKKLKAGSEAAWKSLDDLWVDYYEQ